MNCRICRSIMKPVLTFSKRKSGRKYVCPKCKDESKIKRIHYDEYGKVVDFEQS